MESIGTRLKKARQELGLSLEEVHKKTKIHSDILKAIEEGSLINLSPVYIKGFLKIYCKFLGVDFKDFIADYKEPPSIVKEVSGISDEPASFLKAVSIKLISLKDIPLRIKRVFIGILILIFLSIGLFNLGRIVSSAKKKDQITKLEESKAKAAIPKPEDSLAKPKTETGLGIKLAIRAKENCWIQLKADGKVVFQSILRKGRMENWQAKDKIELSLGNAGGVDLEVNGKLISNLGRKGQVLKNILITKEGLSIPQ